MERTSTASIRTARGLVAALAALNLYRAITQSVTPAEAWNYNLYISPDWRQALSQFDGNNHVLNTLLVRISTAQFHLTELSLRLPSLLCGLLVPGRSLPSGARRFGDGVLFPWQSHCSCPSTRWW